MKVKVKIEGYIDAPDDASREEIEEAVYFSLGFGSMSIDNPIQEPDWDSADIEVFIPMIC